MSYLNVVCPVTVIKTHFKLLFNPDPHQQLQLQIPSSDIYIPVLDDKIHPEEVDNQIKQLKSNKASGVDGVPPGILKFLPDCWIINLTLIFNLAFNTSYPEAWSVSRFFTIFKKGSRLDLGNYHGISILNACAKLYDGVLNNQFIKWYKPSAEQAGGQRGRSCEEQILTI